MTGLAGAGLWFSGITHPYGWTALTVSVFVAVAVIEDALTRTPRSRDVGRSGPAAPAPGSGGTGAIGAYAGRYAEHLVYLGVTLAFAGFAGQALASSATTRLSVGDSLPMGGYLIRLENLVDGESWPTYGARRATVAIYEGERRLGEFQPEQRVYQGSGLNLSEPAILSRLLEDVYVVLAGSNADQKAMLLVRATP